MEIYRWFDRKFSLDLPGWMYLNVVERVRGTPARLEELVRSKDQFIASVSHELRTPLTVVAGMADELSAGWNEFGDGEINELLGLMVEQSRDMTDLIEDLLVAARADIGKVAVSIEEVEKFSKT